MLFYSVQRTHHLKMANTPFALAETRLYVVLLDILIKGGESLEQVRGLDVILLDKTGTLTRGEPELTDVMAFVGFSVDAEDNPRFGENLGVLYLTFPNNRKNAADPDRVLNLVRAKLEHYRDANSERVVALRVVPPRNGPPIGTPVAIRIQSENYAVAKEIAEEMKAELASTPGVFNIDDNLSLGPRELRVKLDPHRASIHGLSFEDVGVALMAANEGLVSSTFKDQVTGEDVDIRVLL